MVKPYAMNSPAKAESQKPIQDLAGPKIQDNISSWMLKDNISLKKISNVPRVKKRNPNRLSRHQNSGGGIGLFPPTFLLLLLYWHWLFTFENGESGDQHSWNTLNRIYFSYKWQIQLTDARMRALISTEDLWPMITIPSIHPIHPSLPIPSKYSIEDNFSWTKMN